MKSENLGCFSEHRNWRLIPKLLIMEGGAPQLEVSLQIQLILDSDKPIYLSIYLSNLIYSVRFYSILFYLSIY